MKAQEAMDLNARSRQGAKEKKVLDRISISKSENGGHIVEHHFSHGMAYHEPEQHVFAKGQGAKLAAHLKKHMGVELAEVKGSGGEADSAYE